MFIIASVLKEAVMNQIDEPNHSPDEIAFTQKQGQYLAFIYAYTRINRCPPAEADMQRHFGVTPPSVHQMIVTLERNRLIKRVPGKPRSIQIIVDPEKLPVLQ